MTSVLELITAGDLPVTLEELRDHLKIEGDCEDETLATLLAAATVWGEKYTRTDFRANTWELTLDCFATRIFLPRRPIASIVSVEYLDEDGASQTVPAARYYLKKTVLGGEILETPDTDGWPSDLTEQEAGITITFTTEAPANCLDLAVLAILRHAAYLYANRGDCSTESAADASGARLLYAMIRVPRV